MFLLSCNLAITSISPEATNPPGRQPYPYGPVSDPLAHLNIGLVPSANTLISEIQLGLFQACLQWWMRLKGSEVVMTKNFITTKFLLHWMKYLERISCEWRVVNVNSRPLKKVPPNCARKCKTWSLMLVLLKEMNAAKYYPNYINPVWLSYRHKLEDHFHDYIVLSWKVSQGALFVRESSWKGKVLVKAMQDMIASHSPGTDMYQLYWHFKEDPLEQ